MLSPEQWNDLHDAARAFAVHVGPALRKAFGREDGVPGEREVMGDGATVSDMESSVSLDGGVPGTRDSVGLGGISVR